ncbi:DNA translocase FtsK 4TM domain-containing protein, partial [Pseudomonas aeruginosa]
AGGAIGQSLGRVAVDALNVQGSTLVFFALFLFGLTVFADLSWFKVMDVTGKIPLDFFELIQNAFNRWMGARAHPAIEGVLDQFEEVQGDLAGDIHHLEPGEVGEHRQAEEEQGEEHQRAALHVQRIHRDAAQALA